MSRKFSTPSMLKNQRIYYVSGLNIECSERCGLDAHTVLFR